MNTLPIDSAWTLLAPEAVPRLDIGRWQAQGRSFFSADVSFVQTLTDPTGRLPDVASLELDIAPIGSTAASTRVRLLTVPLSMAPWVPAAADAGVAAIGGAGFEVLVARTQRVWQIASRPVAGTDVRAPLVVAALAALAFTAPVLPPGGGTIFGVKGVRLRLEALGWPG